MYSNCKSSNVCSNASRTSSGFRLSFHNLLVMNTSSLDVSSFVNTSLKHFPITCSLAYADAQSRCVNPFRKAAAIAKVHASGGFDFHVPKPNVGMIFPSFNSCVREMSFECTPTTVVVVSSSSALFVDFKKGVVLLSRLFFLLNDIVLVDGCFRSLLLLFFFFFFDASSVLFVCDTARLFEPECISLLMMMMRFFFLTWSRVKKFKSQSSSRFSLFFNARTHKK